LKASAEYWQASLGAHDQAKPGATRESTLPDTLEQIYDKHFDFVWRNARRLGVPEASADDVVQDVFMIVQRRLPIYDGRAPMQSWLFGILVRVVATQRRSYRRKAARNVPFDQSISRELTAAQDPTPFEQLERSERAELFANVLGQLDEDKRALLILSELEDWTLREIAELYKSNINTIYSRLRAAKRAFERAYQQAQAGAPAKDGSR
jgi:RNA polymerase sigma-70 factor (ECF subfamily)